MIAIAAIVATLAWLLARDVVTEPLRERFSTTAPIHCARCVSFWVAAVVVPSAVVLADVGWLRALGGGAIGTLVALVLVRMDEALDIAALMAAGIDRATRPRSTPDTDGAGAEE